MIIRMISEFQTSLADPPSSGVITPAAGWFQHILLGSIGTMTAGLAVAAIGFAMLSGRVDLRRGITVLIGCFVLFGAPYIAQGLMGAAGDTQLAVIRPPPPPIYAKPLPTAPLPQSGYDPYAGASVVR